MIEKRISSLFCDEEEFNKAKKYYENALTKSGYNVKLNYNTSTSNNKTSRKRKILWFNPPFSKNVRTNVGGIFLSLIKKHFPSHSKLHKLFNKNNVKVSCSCMPNMEKVISGHNSTLLRNETAPKEERKCNCKRPEYCPLKNECLTKSLVYKATVTTSKDVKFYYGLTEGDFKKRWNSHNLGVRCVICVLKKNCASLKQIIPKC